MQKIRIICGSSQAEAKILDKNPKTAEAILKNLPIEGTVIKWGDEYYFYTDIKVEEENSQTEMEIGDIAYWPEGRAICIFLGPTPVSSDDRPVAISPVNLFAKLEDKIEIKDGEKIRIEKVE
jgi:hypothetical protein